MKFVILDHFPPETNTKSAARTEDRHFDLMFEVADGKELATYATLELPRISDSTEVTKLVDHRNAYLDYEGQVSNNRGVVQRYAFGVWSGELTKEALLDFDAVSENFAAESWTIRFSSEQLFRIT
jgi:hypothetical protein